MAQTLQQTKVAVAGGKNILASSLFQYVHGGATFDGSKFKKGLVEVGTLIARNDKTGKYEPFTVAEGFSNFYVLNEDHIHDGKTDFVTGAVIIAGSVYVGKLPEGAEALLKTFAPLNQKINFVKHV